MKRAKSEKRANKKKPTKKDLIQMIKNRSKRGIKIQRENFGEVNPWLGVPWWTWGAIGTFLYIVFAIVLARVAPIKGVGFIFNFLLALMLPAWIAVKAVSVGGDYFNKRKGKK
jgi:hypothetical protein